MFQIKKIVSSYVTMIVLLFLYAVGLSAATFIEKEHGTALAKVLIYYSPLFFLLQFLLVVNFVAIVRKYHWLSAKRWGMLVLHGSFIIILLGALISHCFSIEGRIHLREGEKSNQLLVQTNRGMRTLTLPFDFALQKFTLVRYPGSMSPSSYESDLLVYVDGETRQERVYMNNVLDLKGYRFFQASFDADEKGTILSVNKDVVGRNVTYTGYVLLLIGFVLCLIEKNSRLRYLFRQISQSKVLILIAIGCLDVCSIHAAGEPSTMKQAISEIKISPAHAEQFGMMPVQSSSGRIMPMNTFSSEILRKLHKENDIEGMTCDQFLLSLMAFPEMWSQVPFITLPDEKLADYYGLTHAECAYAELFQSDGSYKLQNELDEAYRKSPTERTAFDKDVIKLDEQINVFHQAAKGQLMRLFPDVTDAGGRWYAPGEDLSAYTGEDSTFVSRIFIWYLSEVRNSVKSGDWNKAGEVLNMVKVYQEKRGKAMAVDSQKLALEFKYNKLNLFRWCKIAYLSLGGLMLLFSFLSFFRERRGLRWIIYGLSVLVGLTFVLHTLGMGMRWHIGGYAPWSNSYETMVYVAWATIVAGSLFLRRSSITFALATLFSGIILFVSGLNWMDPQISPLVPVLKSPWLMFHVAILMAAYGFFGISCLIGIANLLIISFLGKQKIGSYSNSLRELSIINEASLLLGLILMTVGTFMGAVWANESWGRYWGWDPKETWALITMVIYAIVTHLHLLPRYYNMWTLNLSSVLAFTTVLMTYFGVNYFLSGMHSYGQNDNIHGLFVYLYAAAVAVILLAVASWKGHSLKLQKKN